MNCSLIFYWIYLISEWSLLRLFRYLYGNQLHGDIPLSIGNLVNLTTLYDIFVGIEYNFILNRYLNGNQLNGEIPTSIVLLTNLNVLYETIFTFISLNTWYSSYILRYHGRNLSQNQFNGEIPSTIGKMINLGHL